MTHQDVEDCGNASIEVVDAFVAAYRHAAIPGLIGACALWAVEHGGADVVKGSLRNAIKLVDEMERSRRKELS